MVAVHLHLREGTMSITVRLESTEVYKFLIPPAHSSRLASTLMSILGCFRTLPNSAMQVREILKGKHCRRCADYDGFEKEL